MPMSKQELSRRLETELEFIEKTQTRPGESARDRERRAAYLHGWSAAADAVNFQEGHPDDADRQPEPGKQPRDRSRTYDHSRGYAACMEASADIQWQHHLEEHPEDGLPRNLENRRNATLLKLTGRTGQEEGGDIEPAYTPASTAGCRRMLERIREEQRHAALSAKVKSETWRQKLAYPECRENSHQTWLRVTLEELGECAKVIHLDGMTQAELKKLEKEIVQVAASCLNWIQTRLRGDASETNKVR